MCKYFHDEEISDSRGLFTLADKGRTRDNDWKLKQDEFRLEISETNQWALVDDWGF